MQCHSLRHNSNNYKNIITSTTGFIGEGADIITAYSPSNSTYQQN